MNRQGHRNLIHHALVETPGGIVEHRHLLPDEFDLLVDGEEGFGVAPLLAHVEACPACRAGIEARRRLVAALERLPRLDPSPLFAYHVMTRVRVFEPWYVAALDTVRRFVPRSRPARVLAGATASLVATVLTAATLLIASRLDAALFLANVATEQVRTSAMSAAGSLLLSALGDGLVAALRGSGATGVAIALTSFVGTVIVAAVSLRAVTAASRRRRS